MRFMLVFAALLLACLLGLGFHRLPELIESLEPPAPRAVSRARPAPLDVETVLEQCRKHRKRGHDDRAAEVLEEALAHNRRHLGPSHPDTIELAWALADLHRLRERLDAAAPLLQEVYAATLQRQGPSSQECYQVLAALIDVYERMGKQEAAEACFTPLLARTNLSSAPAEARARLLLEVSRRLARASYGRVARCAARRALREISPVTEGHEELADEIALWLDTLNREG